MGFSEKTRCQGKFLHYVLKSVYEVCISLRCLNLYVDPKREVLSSLKLLFLTPIEGRGTIYSDGFFCSDNFGRSIYSS